MGDPSSRKTSSQIFPVASPLCLGLLLCLLGGLCPWMEGPPHPGGPPLRPFPSPPAQTLFLNKMPVLILDPLILTLPASYFYIR